MASLTRRRSSRKECVTSTAWETTEWQDLVDFRQIIPTKHFFKPAYSLKWFVTVKLRSVGINCLWLVDCMGWILRFTDEKPLSFDLVERLFSKWLPQLSLFKLSWFSLIQKLDFLQTTEINTKKWVIVAAFSLPVQPSFPPKKCSCFIT